MYRFKTLGSPSFWLRRVVDGRAGQRMLFGASFLEGLILPIPLEAVLAPYMQMRRDILWRIATIGVLGFVCATLAGYAVGALLFDDVGAPIIARMGWEAEFARAEVMLGKYGFWALALIAVTPIPTQIAMLVAGSLGYPVLLFALAMGVARGARYYGLALLVSLYGDRVVAWIGRRRGAVAEAGYPPR